MKWIFEDNSKLEDQERNVGCIWLSIWHGIVMNLSEEFQDAFDENTINTYWDRYKQENLIDQAGAMNLTTSLIIMNDIINYRGENYKVTRVNNKEEIGDKGFILCMWKTPYGGQFGNTHYTLNNKDDIEVYDPAHGTLRLLALIMKLYYRIAKP